MWQEANDIRGSSHNVFVFDMEWIGDVKTPKECKIWEIGCIHVNTGDGFRISVMPTLTGDNFSLDHNGSDAVPAVTRASIAQDELATNLENAIRAWQAWVRVYTDSPIMISHNCFASDLPVLKFECWRCGCEMDNWLFMDSLPFIRYRLRGMCTNFRIIDLCEHLNLEIAPHPHRALEDADMLTQILQCLCKNTDAPIISGFSTKMSDIPLQAISGVGHTTAKRLDEACEITNIWQLYQAVTGDGQKFTSENVADLLLNKLGSYMSEDMANKIGESALEWSIKLCI